MYHHVTVAKLEEMTMEFCFRFTHPEIFENPRCYLEKSLFIVPTRSILSPLNEPAGSPAVTATVEPAPSPG